ncbi:MAG: DUF4258 domain-containing protein [Magnetococcus sp. YQC-5]
MGVVIHSHARERMMNRGASEEEVVAAIKHGERFLAKQGRQGFRKNFSFDVEWRGKRYANKLVELFAVAENGDWVVVTVIVKFY